MEAIRLGTIGSGVIVHSVLDNVKTADGITLEAVYSRTKDKAESLAKVYSAPKIYTDINALLNDERVNTIYIATPNLLHYEQAKISLTAGKMLSVKSLLRQNSHTQRNFLPSQSQKDSSSLRPLRQSIFLTSDSCVRN